MGNNQKYSIDFKLQVVGKYEQGKCGYKRLAREFNEPTEKVPPNEQIYKSHQNH